MPYDIVKRGEEWCVVSPRRTHGCHSTKEKARRQQRALYENAPPEEESAMTTITSTEGVSLNEVGTSTEIGAATTVTSPSALFFAAQAEAEAEAPAEEQRGPAWRGPLGVEGKPTSDGRVLMAGEIGDRDLPLPMNVQITTAEGHDGSENAGRIEVLKHIPFKEFDPELADEFGLKDMPEGSVVIWGEGTFDTSQYADEGMRLLSNGSGVSLDLPIERVALLDPTTLEEVDTDELSLEEILLGDFLQGLAGKVGGVTIVTIPAFEDASIKVDTPAVTAAAGAGILTASANVYGSIKIDGNPEFIMEGDSVVGLLFDRALTAAAGPVKPPKHWMLDPCLTELTPLSITKEGQVFGHLADWDGCHVGFQGICMPPFRSNSDYAYFNAGEIETAEGDLIPCGKIMFSMEGFGHAPVDDPNMSYQDVQDYYDDATKVGAFVRAGSDRYGTWLAGCVRPGLSEIEVQHLRTHPPSGDWRPIKGGHELIAAFAVPIGGFPIARHALVASANGQVSAVITAPLEIEEELGQRRKKRKRYMLSDRLTEALGHRVDARARMRKEMVKAIAHKTD